MTKEGERDDDVRLDWRDYLAVVIAAMQTTLLPFLVLIVSLIVILLVLRW